MKRYGGQMSFSLAVIPLLGVPIFAQSGPASPQDLSGVRSKGMPEKVIRGAIRQRIADAIRVKGHPFDGPGSVPRALLDALRDKRLIGLGEGTHGTSELVTLRGNIILALAEREKVAVFMEDQAATFTPINQWIQGERAEGELPGLMSGLFGVTNTAEFGDFLKAARAFNAKHPQEHQIEIFGVDMQIDTGPAANPIPALRTWLAAKGISIDAELAIAEKYVQDVQKRAECTPAQMAVDRGAIVKIYGAVVGADHALPGWVEAMVAANNLDRYAEFDRSLADTFSTVQNAMGDPASIQIAQGIRDGCMAETIKMLMDSKLSKAGKGVFWGHNGHVARLSYLDDPDADGVLPGAWANTGSLLNRWLRDAYAPVAFLTGEGSVRTKTMDGEGKLSEWKPVQAPPVLPDCLNAIAKKATPKPVFFLTREVPGLDQVFPELGLGVPYYIQHPERTFVRTIPGMAYFGIVSLPVSQAAHPMEQVSAPNPGARP